MAGNLIIKNAQDQEFRITHNDNVGAVTIESDKIATKAYVDDLKTIAAGAATFTATTNNINLTGIGIGVEVGDVIQISGATDSKNNSEFTVEVITDDDNIIVNQAHANKGTSKNVATRAGDTGVTVKLLAKWYNAPIGMGQDWVDVTSNRAFATTYANNTNRAIGLSICIVSGNTSSAGITIDDNLIGKGKGEVASNGGYLNKVLDIGRLSNYSFDTSYTSKSIVSVFERR